MGTIVTAEAPCPSGVVVGGGAVIDSINPADRPRVAIIESQPVGQGWRATVVVTQQLDQQFTLKVTALCQT